MAKLEKKEKKEKKKKRFFKDFKAELKKVTWPTPKQMVNNTTAVITIVLITAVIVFLLDVCFEALNKYGINQLRSKIETSNITEAEETETTQNETAETEETENEVTEGEEAVENESTDSETVQENSTETPTENEVVE